LPLEPPSQNSVAQNKGNYRARKRYAKIRDDYILLLKNAKQRLSIPDARHLRRVVITRLYSGRGQARDRANIVGGCKPLLDAMHLSGLLVDDAEEFVQDFYRQARSNASGVGILLEELG
jgi:hypothetical protein